MSEASSPEVTIVIVPRDRFSSIHLCVDSILKNTDVPFRLAILDFGYAPSDIAKVRERCTGVDLEIVPVGRTIPMVAFRDFLPKVTTKYLAWVDNDTFASEGWMTALLERAAMGARVILPVTLEREGLDIDDRRLVVRNHVSHTEFRRTEVDGKQYAIDFKPFRRAAPEEIPQGGHTVDYFELHAFFAETEVLRQLDYPPMVIREHIDLGIQLNKLGIPIWCEPKAIVHFDNIHERPTYRDLKFFFYRWNQRLVNESADLFEKRWGYRFYNEQFMKNWAFRRKTFSVGRFLYIPHKGADFIARVMHRLLAPKIPAKFLKEPKSERVLTPVATAATPRSLAASPS